VPFGGQHAIVVGASMAGLLTARVLSEHFEQVTVVERDALIDTSIEPRKGVPQSRHLHVLLARGEQIVNGLFPGLTADLEAEGAISFDFGQDVAWYHFGDWKVRAKAGVRTLGVSRPRLESHVRRRVFALPNVNRRDEHDAIGLLTNDSRTRVTGLTVKRRDSSSSRPGDRADLNSTNEQLEAELVVDAAGRGSRLPTWLEELGCGRPQESTVTVRVGYATRLYRRPDPWPHPWQLMYVLGTAPQSRRLGVIAPREDGRVAVVLAGILDDHAPADPEGFLEFARGLPAPDLHRALTELEPDSDIAIYKFPANLRRHYERMKQFPDGLAVVGDALASFNPIYGQGMTTAGFGALALGECLAQQRRGDIGGLSRRYLAMAAKFTDAPWLMTTSEDFRYPEIEGRRPPLYGALKWYLGQVHRATKVDADVLTSFLRAMHMLDGPEKLMTPSAAIRVLRSARRA
jgi:2-polyprenyl-6-methoxyphenol hydroxylase-like FAD-dependent oxidoreductase